MKFASLRDVHLKTGNYFQQLQLMLERLESFLEPRKPSPIAGGSFSALIADPGSFIGSLNPPDNSLLETVESHLEVLERNAKDLGLESVKKRLKRIREYIASINSLSLSTFGDEKLKHEIRVLREALDDDLKERIVFFPTEAKVKDWMVSHPFGEEVSKAFPSAKSDLSWAAFSFLTDNWTGSVFYLMRAIEQVMRELAAHLGIKSISRKSPIPVEYAEWAVVCDALKAKISVLQQKKRGAKKAADLLILA